MRSHSINLWRESRHVPRRTWTYLFIRRKFHFFITTLAIFGFFSTLPINNLLVVIIITLITSLPASIFWGAFHLDLSTEEWSHPHHRKGWKKSQKFLKRVAVFLQRIPRWLLIIIFWLFATIGLFLSVSNDDFAFFVMQSWLLYLVILFFASWLIYNRSSDWFIGLSALSTIAYAIAVWNSNLPNKPNLIASNGNTLLLVGAIVHLLRRLILEDRGRASVAEEVTRKLSIDVSYLVPFEQPVLDGELASSLNEIASDIASKLVYDNVYIVLYDKNKGLLYLKGANAPISDSWKKHPWSVSEKSITAWVALHKQQHLCPNTSICDFYYGPEGIKCVSEAAVPILVEGECVGVLDVESPHPRAFDEADLSLLSQVANAMATALAHRRQINREIDKVYQLFEKLARDLSSSETFFNALDLIVAETSKSFGADLVTLYPHAIDTQLPLPYLAWAGESCDQTFLRKYLGPNNRVLALLSQRNPKEPEYYSEYADEDALLLGPNQGEYTAEEQSVYGRRLRFVKREVIKSTAFLSLGIGNNVVGSLFLNYRERTCFDQNYRQKLKGLGSFLSLALLLKRRVERLSGPLAGVAPLSHSKAAAAFEAFRRAVERGADLQKTVVEFKKDWADAVLIEVESLRTKTISESLSRLKSKVEELYPEVIYDEDIDSKIGQLPIELQGMIYALISEAVANALFHGEATEIRVKANVERSQFVLAIQNNGTLIEEKQLSLLNALADLPLEAYTGRSGIRALLMDARNWFGANWNFECKDRKTIFTAGIPFLELISEE
jgi:GAF domain-containing protein